MKESLPLKIMSISQILLIKQKIHFENLFLYRYKGFSYLLYSCCNPCKSMYRIIHYANLQLSSCIIHVCTSIGKFLRSIGQESIKVNLKEHKKLIKNIPPQKKGKKSYRTVQEGCMNTMEAIRNRIHKSIGNPQKRSLLAEPI